MNERDFCYWLQGFFELTASQQSLTVEQVLMIKDHLSLVFNKVTPDRQAQKVNEKQSDVNSGTTKISEFAYTGSVPIRDLSDAELDQLLVPFRTKYGNDSLTTVSDDDWDAVQEIIGEQTRRTIDKVKKTRKKIEQRFSSVSSCCSHHRKIC